MARRSNRTLAVLFLIVAGICLRLGIWQFDRLTTRRATNAAAAARRALPPVILLDVASRSDTSLIERRVVADGRFDDAHAIVLRNQVLGGVPGVSLVTPLVLAGSDTAVLVQRGFIPAPDGVHPTHHEATSSRAPERIEGIALPIGRGGRGQPLTHNSVVTWARLDLAQLRDSLPYPLLGVYIRRSAAPVEASGFPRAVPAPSLEDGPHLSYALQWVGFAAVALVFSVILWRKD